MQAFVCTKLGKTFEEALKYCEFKEISIPEPNAYQLQIKVESASLNFADCLRIMGKYQTKSEPPFVPCSEMSGIVTKIGSKVKGFNVGDRVAGNSLTGGLCEYTLATSNLIWKMPDNMTFNDGAGFTVTYGTAYMALIQRGNIKPKDNVLITAAAGGVGTACIQISKAVGCKNIIACVGSPYKMNIAKECGASKVINYKETPNWGKSLKKKGGIDIACSIVGGNAFDQSLKAINFKGRILILGFAGNIIQKIKANHLLLKQCDIKGVWWGNTLTIDYNEFRSSVNNSFKMYENGLIKPLIGGIYTMNTIKDGLTHLFNRKSVGKLIVEVNKKTQKSSSKL